MKKDTTSFLKYARLQIEENNRHPDEIYTIRRRFHEYIIMAH